MHPAAKSAQLYKRIRGVTRSRRTYLEVVWRHYRMSIQIPAAKFSAQLHKRTCMAPVMIEAAMRFKGCMSEQQLYLRAATFHAFFVIRGCRSMIFDLDVHDIDPPR